VDVSDSGDLRRYFPATVTHKLTIQSIENVEHFPLINQTIASTMCNTTSILDDASPSTEVPEMIETTESISIVVVDEEDEQEEEEEEEEEDEEEESLEDVGKMIQDLFRSDNAKVNASLAALNLDLNQDKRKCDKIQAVGGCFALVHLMQNCLDRANDRISACDQVTKLNEVAELTTLNKTLGVIISLTFLHDESIVGIAAIGGVEAVVKVMKTFPKCQMLQKRLCSVLLNLASNNIGKARAIESGGIEALIAAVNNHLSSAIVSQKACSALCNIVRGSKENTGLLITLGGGAAVAKVRTKWPNDDHLQTKVRRLANLIAAEMKAWADEV
jgi:hypothetical protein